MESATRGDQSVRLQGTLTPRADSSAVLELYPGEAEDVGTPSVLVTGGAPRLFEAFFDSQYLHTSNVYLTERATMETGILVNTVQAAFTPRPLSAGDGQIAFRAGYRHQRYNYGLDKTSNQFNNIDFDSGTAFLNGRYTFGRNWTALFEVDYNRLISHEDGWHEFYTELSPVWGLERQFPISPSQWISLAFVGSFHWTYTEASPDTNSSNRLDSILALSYNVEALPRLLLQPYYRIQHSHYSESTGRDDLLHTAGISVVYQLTDRASIRSFVSWEARESSDSSIADYRKLDAGGGLSLVFQF